jgi:hypothetical protein
MSTPAPGAGRESTHAAPPRADTVIGSRPGSPADPRYHRRRGGQRGRRPRGGLAPQARTRHDVSVKPPVLGGSSLHTSMRVRSRQGVTAGEVPKCRQPCPTSGVRASWRPTRQVDDPTTDPHSFKLRHRAPSEEPSPSRRRPSATSGRPLTREGLVYRNCVASLDTTPAVACVSRGSLAYRGPDLSDQLRTPRLRRSQVLLAGQPWRAALSTPISVAARRT